MVSGKFTEELLRAPDDILSFRESAIDVGSSVLYFQCARLIIVSVSENQIHYGKAPREGWVPPQDHSRISKEIQFTLGRVPSAFTSLSVIWPTS
jgi:hypothetical protein